MISNDEASQSKIVNYISERISEHANFGLETFRFIHSKIFGIMTYFDENGIEKNVKMEETGTGQGIFNTILFKYCEGIENLKIFKTIPKKNQIQHEFWKKKLQDIKKKKILFPLFFKVTQFLHLSIHLF